MVMDRQEEDIADRKWLGLVEDVYEYVKAHPGCTRRDLAGSFAGRLHGGALVKLLDEGRVTDRGKLYAR